MGQYNSRLLEEEELEQLIEQSLFTINEIKLLYERFKILDRSCNGYITFNDLMMVPEFHSNPISGILLNAIEETTEFENITFPIYLEVLQIFHRGTNKTIRSKFIFKAFDLNKDGKLCQNVLENLYMLVNEELDKAAIKKVLDCYDKGNKGYLNYRDFTRFYKIEKIDEILILDFNKSIEKQNSGFFRL